MESLGVFRVPKLRSLSQVAWSSCANQTWKLSSVVTTRRLFWCTTQIRSCIRFGGYARLDQRYVMHFRFICSTLQVEEVEFSSHVPPKVIWKYLSYSLSSTCRAVAKSSKALAEQVTRNVPWSGASWHKLWTFENRHDWIGEFSVQREFSMLRSASENRRRCSCRQVCF